MILRIRNLSKPLLIVLSLFVAAGLVLGLYFIWSVYMIEDIWTMNDTQVSDAISPDGKYEAILYYKDGPTYGYQHIVLEPHREHLSDNDVKDIAELVNEGVFGLSWRNNKTLVVDYDATKQKEPADNTEFVHQEKTCQGVTIEYHKSFEPKSTDTPSQNPSGK